MNKMEFNAILAEIEEVQADRYIRARRRLMPLLDGAVESGDWERVHSLITLNPEIMEDGLKRIYPLLPDVSPSRKNGQEKQRKIMQKLSNRGEENSFKAIRRKPAKS